MKIAAATVLALAASASAFTTSPVAKTSVSLRMSEEAVVEEPAEPASPAMSESMPFMVRPAALDGSLAGDVGFDPLGFSKTKEDLWNYREAEVKHARLAMLAAAGWPLSELWDKTLAKTLGLTPIVGADDRAPSILNGGLGKISPLYWIFVILGTGLIEFFALSQRRANVEYIPGKLNFDPLGVYPKNDEGKEWMQLAEIKNGRLAMIAITAFAFQEAVTKVGVIDETPLFFKPIGTVLREYANSGYL